MKSRTWTRLAGTSAAAALVALAVACSGDTSSAGAGDGGACAGPCAPGSRCTVHPPPGSDAPSVDCVCTAAGAWCCDGTCRPDGGSGGSGASAGSAGAGATGGTGGTGGASGTGGTSGTSGTSGASGTGGDCAADCAGSGLICCAGRCVNTGNDLKNCGACGNACEGPFPYCDNGTCGAPPCFGTACAGNTTCCGSECCGLGQICCTVNVGPSVTECSEPVDGTCPVGCPLCVCADPDTPVATPTGEVPIAALRVGDLVYSMDGGHLAVVPVARVNRAAARDHRVVRVLLETGRTLDVSARHPTADLRTFGDLVAGTQIDGVRVTDVRTVPYRHDATYDILPRSDSGTYFAAGVLIGSTLR